MNPNISKELEAFCFALKKLEKTLIEEINSLSLKDKVVEEHQKTFVQNIPLLGRTPPRVQSYVFQTVKSVRKRLFNFEKRKRSH